MGEELRGFAERIHNVALFQPLFDLQRSRKYPEYDSLAVGFGIDEVSQYDSYTVEDFLSEVFITEERYNTLKNLLIRKKNIILQGAPGVGKTYAAERPSMELKWKLNRNEASDEGRREKAKGA